MKAREAIFPGFQTGWWCGVAFQRGSVTVASLCQKKGTPAISNVWCCTTAPLYTIDDEVCLTLIAAQPNRGHLSPLPKQDVSLTWFA